MSVSTPFIHRPIATSLLGVAAMLGGWLGYWWLPVSSLPQVDFPTIQVTTQLPGASPDTIAALVTAPLERQFGQIPALAADDLVELVRHQPGHAAIRPRPRHRRRRAGRAVGDQRRRLDAAAQPALSAALFQGEPGRRADHHAGADLRHRRVARAKRPRRHDHGAAAGRGDRRRPRLGAGRHPAGGAHPGRPVAARRLRHRRSRICAPPSSAPMSPAPKGALDGAHQSYTIAANDQIAGADDYARWSWPIATARRCC